MPDMQKKYKEEIRPALQAKLGLKNVMQIPGLKRLLSALEYLQTLIVTLFLRRKSRLVLLQDNILLLLKPAKTLLTLNFALVKTSELW